MRRPYPQFSNVSVLNPPLGNSAYHGGILKIERRFRAGLSLLAHYTFSKYLDDVESFTELGDVGSYIRQQHPASRCAERRLRASGAARSRLDHGRVRRMESGRPYHHANRCCLHRLQLGGPDQRVSGRNSACRYSGDPHASGGTTVRWFNTDAFRSPGALQFGTAGRGILDGPGQWNIDASWIKSFAIRERWRVELRAEFFNFLNHANFGLPAHSAGTPAFGTITSANAGRSTQLAVRIEF